MCVCFCVLAYLSVSLFPQPLFTVLTSVEWISESVAASARSPLPVLIERHLMRRAVAALLQQQQRLF